MNSIDLRSSSFANASFNRSLNRPHSEPHYFPSLISNMFEEEVIESRRNRRYIVLIYEENKCFF